VDATSIRGLYSLIFILGKIYKVKRILLFMPGGKDSQINFAFVNAPYRCFDVNRKGGKHPNNGAIILAGELLENKLVDNIKIFDGSFYDSLDYLMKDIKSFNPTVVGVSAYTDSLPETRLIFDNLGDVPYKITGGPYATARPEEMLDYADIVFLAEAEISLKKFMGLIKENGSPSPANLKEIPGIVFQENGTNIYTGNAELIHNLDEISFKGRELVGDNFKNFKIANYRFLNNNFVSIMTSRGCISSCLYCNSNMMHGRGYRFRSVDSIESEIDFIEKLRDDHGLPKLECIKFDDDDIMARNESELTNLFDMLRKRNLSSTGFASVNAVTPSKIEMASQNGLKSLFFGVETNEKRREYIGKGIKGKITNNDVAECANLCRKYGIKTSAGYIIGFPQESVEDIHETIDCMVKIPIDFPSMNVLTIHPGTPLWNWQQKNQELYTDLEDNPFVTVDRGRWPHSPEGLPSPHPNLTKNELEELKNIAYIRAYSDDDRIFRLMSNVKNPQEAKKTFLALNDYYSIAIK
jgi:anaerobic magnesium-protoporphyrin IX monomethyl ester cyclase